MTARRRYKPMLPLTRKAERLLRKCIREKWEPLAKRKLDFEPDCVLCDEYQLDDKDDCRLCPVRHRTGEAYCAGSPYNEWFDMDVDTPGSISGAKRELRFLRDTLRLGLAAREKAKERKK